MAERVATGTVLLNPFQILKDVGVGFGMMVGDLGCGSGGFFALQAAKLVGARGRVYAVDVVKHVLQSIEAKASIEGVGNIITVWSNLEVYGGAKTIKDQMLDVAIIVNVLFQSKQKADILREARRMLKPTGKLVVIDWKTTSSPVGPVIGDRVTEESLLAAAHEAGLKEVSTFEAGKFHYGFVFAP